MTEYCAPIIPTPPPNRGGWQAPKPAWVARGQLVTTDFGGIGLPDGHAASITGAECTPEGWHVTLDPPHPSGRVDFPLRWCKPVFLAGQDAKALSEIHLTEAVEWISESEGGTHD